MRFLLFTLCIFTSALSFGEDSAGSLCKELNAQASSVCKPTTFEPDVHLDVAECKDSIFREHLQFSDVQKECRAHLNIDHLNWFERALYIGKVYIIGLVPR